MEMEANEEKVEKANEGGTEPKPKKGWFVCTFNWAGLPKGVRPIPRGPWNSMSEADQALGRWRKQAGEKADEIMEASAARVLGPFKTRKEARIADVATPGPVAKSLS